MPDAIEKPDCVDDDQLQEILIFLDGLRDSGVTNMYAATPYIEEFCADNDIEIDGRDAGQLLKYWMRTFGERHP